MAKDTTYGVAADPYVRTKIYACIGVGSILLDMTGPDPEVVPVLLIPTCIGSIVIFVRTCTGLIHWPVNQGLVRIPR